MVILCRGVRERRVAPSRSLNSDSRRSRLVSIGSQPDPGQVHLCVLGRFELSVMNRPVAIPRPSQRVLALLGVEDQLVPRSFAAGTLWPDANDAAARSNLRSALWRLGWHRRFVLQIEPDAVRLKRDVAVDLRERRSLARLLLDRAAKGERVELSPSLFESDLLPTWCEEWVEPQRESYRQLRLHSLEAICDHLMVKERFGEALDAAFMAISTSPFRESAHRAVILALLAEGNRGEGLRHYERFRSSLKEELGVEPSFRFDDLREQALSATS
jgi:DNA-binding SARP family transcriptional activator